MKTVFALIFILLFIISGVYFVYKRPIKDNLQTDRIENKDSEKNSAVGGSRSSSAEETINGNNFKKINMKMKLTSSAFENNQYIPFKYACDGANINPPLSIAGVPEGTESLVLIVDDPDAPSGDWVHWTIFNIPPNAKEIKEGGGAPAGSIESKTNFRNTGYGGPCPPSGIHHYQFKLYALDSVLNLDASADKKDIEKSMTGRILAQDLLVGLYERK